MTDYEEGGYSRRKEQVSKRTGSEESGSAVVARLRFSESVELAKSFA